MKIKHLTLTLAGALFLSTAYCQDSSTHHLKKKNSMEIHSSDSNWNNNSMKKNRNHLGKSDTATTSPNSMKKAIRRTHNASQKADSLKR